MAPFLRAVACATAVLGNFAANRLSGDRPARAAARTGVVARNGANFVDLGTRLGDGLYVLMAELQLPSEASAPGLETELWDAARELGVEVHLSPIDDDLL